MAKEQEKTFEASITRIEEILEKMNRETISLEDSLKLFEEADQLIISCHKKLTEAEKKVETLLKNRQGELLLGPNGEPVSEPL